MNGSPIRSSPDARRAFTACGSVEHRPGAAEAGYSVGHVGKHVPVVADVHVAVPEAGDEGLAAAVDRPCVRRRRDRLRRPIRRDLAVARSTAWFSTNTPLSASNSRTLSNSSGALLPPVRKRFAIAFTSAAVVLSCKLRIALVFAAASNPCGTTEIQPTSAKYYSDRPARPASARQGFRGPKASFTVFGPLGP
jgi:hypothetical protein